MAHVEVGPAAFGAQVKGILRGQHARRIGRPVNRFSVDVSGAHEELPAEPSPHGNRA